MKILERLQAQLDQLTAAAPATPFNERVAEAKQAHTGHLINLHAVEDREEVLKTIVHAARVEALRIKQFVDRKEIHKLAGSSYPLHPNKNTAVIQSLAQRLEDQSITYGMNHGMTADEVRTVVRDVWEQTFKSRVSTVPLQAVIEANKPYIPSQTSSFNPSSDAVKWLELAKADYQHRLDWDWDPCKAKELTDEFVEQVIFQASRSMGVVWPDGTKRNKLTGSDLAWLERAIRQHCTIN